MTHRLLSMVPLVWVLASSVASGQDVGQAVVIGEAPVRVDFQVPEDSFYQFQYDPARITLWDSVDRQSTILPGAPAASGPAGVGCEVDLSDFASLQTCFSGTGGGVAAGCEAFDTNADNDVDLDDHAAFHGTFIGPVCNVVIVPVFVEGLLASTGLGDTVLTLLTRPATAKTYAVESIQTVTVVSIDISPTSGPLGTEVTITLQPATPPIVFDSSSTADWLGVFDPTLGPPSTQFGILYDETQLVESGAASSKFVIGDGTLVNAPNFETLDFPGSLDGSLTLNLGIALTRSSGFTPTVVPVVWESITYLDSSISTGPPVLNGEPSELPLMIVSGDPNPVPNEVVLVQSYWAHLAAVLRVAENPSTLAGAPSFVEVDLVTFDSLGVELDRRENVRLDRVTGNDGDPSNLVYQSDLTNPIVLVDVALDPANYPNVMVLQAEVSGHVQILPQ